MSSFFTSESDSKYEEEDAEPVFAPRDAQQAREHRAQVCQLFQELIILQKNNSFLARCNFVLLFMFFRYWLA